MKTFFSALALLAVWLAVPSDAQATFPLVIRSSPVVVQVDPFFVQGPVVVRSFDPFFVPTNRAFIGGYGFNAGFSNGVIVDPFFRQRGVVFIDRFGRVRVR